jgi:hypothetical protein
MNFMDIAILAKGLRAFADALDGGGVSEKTTPPKTKQKAPVEDADRAEQKEVKPEIEAPTETEIEAPTETEIEAPTETEIEAQDIGLEDLQELGSALIQSGKRSAFRKVLGDYDLPNLSASKPGQYQILWEALKKAGE